ncbi:unnamed protein product [Amoebophrya sp. A25]|nr:unnamed protein product [Amoebophrya sp. A25]|eukprot:GSA25T00021694001.1
MDRKTAEQKESDSWKRKLFANNSSNVGSEGSKPATDYASMGEDLAAREQSLWLQLEGFIKAACGVSEVACTSQKDIESLLRFAQILAFAPRYLV